MLNLIKLEIKKFNLKKNIKGVAITNLVILGIVSFILIASKSEVDVAFTDFNEGIGFIDIMSKATFIIYSSVILASLTVEEYKSKTINLMFMYPISRKKIFTAKLIIVSVFAFVNIVISDAFLISALGIIDGFIDIIPGGLTMSIVLDNGLMLILGALYASFMALIPLYFGMKKKSTPATIVSAVVLVCIVCSGNGATTVLVNVLPISFAIGLVGVLVSGAVLNKLENMDVL